MNVLPPEWFPNLCPTNLGADPNLDGAQQSKTELLRHAAGIDLEGRTKMSRAQLVRAIDKEGPCLDCYRTGEPVVNQDLASAGGRWSLFAAEALAAGYASVHALPMRLRGAVIGALNLFHIDPGMMRPADIAAAQAMADVATIAVLQHRATVEAQIINEQLSHALNSRVIIEQAKGMLSERMGIDVDQAFGQLRSHVRNHNRRLVDVAQDVLDGRLSRDAFNPPSPS